jgi:uncharacterized protein (DUF488 family)
LNKDSEILLFTIGFTKKSAERFFGLLMDKGIKRIIDIRLNNISQLAGYAKLEDLRYFLRKIGNIEYVHEPKLAPSKEILTAFRKHEITWESYQNEFRALLVQCVAEKVLAREQIHMGCLLCSEAEHDQCHRRLVAEYFKSHHKGLKVVHLH